MDIVQDLVDGTSKNVVRLTAVAGTGSGTSLATPATCHMVMHLTQWCVSRW